MFDLEKPLRLDVAAMTAPNLTDRFSERDLARIGNAVLEGYKVDKGSRAGWERRTEAALNLALQLQEVKTFPWNGASNVKFPLVTVAAIQWHSRAYPLLVAGPELVKARILGQDPDGAKRDRADRVTSFMSYQLLEEMPEWEGETDRGLLQLPIIGCAFKKTYYNGALGRNTSELVPAKDFVVNYWAKSIQTAPRATHIIPLYRNDIYEKSRLGVWRDVLQSSWYAAGPQIANASGDAAANRRTGMTPPATSDFTTPFTFLEQYVRMDLDEDGYAEPYIITVEESSGYVCRIVFNSEPGQVFRTTGNRILRIEEDQVFTKLSFIPSPDGGFYDIGFGLLLGPINQSVDSLINQLIDSGTLATTAGGFLGRGVKIRGGEQSFRPFGWQRVDSTGEDLAKGIYPFPVREPSNVLFMLLSLLIDYTNRVSGSTDIMVGVNPGQNTPAATSQLMAEQGSKINSAIFKRVWVGFKEEYVKLYKLNRKYVPVTIKYFGEKSGWIRREDFLTDPDTIRPAADPNIASNAERIQQALTVKQQAMTSGGYDPDAVERNLLRALRVEGMETLYPGIAGKPAPKPPQVALEEIKQQGRMAEKQLDARTRFLEMMIEAEREAGKTEAEILLIKAQIAQIVSEIGEAQAASQVKAFEAQVGALTKLQASQQGFIKLLQEGMKNGQSTGNNGGTVPRMEAPSGDSAGLPGIGSSMPGADAAMVAGGVPPQGA
jgi:chaperonin GroES